MAEAICLELHPIPSAKSHTGSTQAQYLDFVLYSVDIVNLPACRIDDSWGNRRESSMYLIQYPKCGSVSSELSAHLIPAMQEPRDQLTMQATKHTTRPTVSMPPKLSTQSDKSSPNPPHPARILLLQSNETNSTD
jgi:hypothetical protein